MAKKGWWRQLQSGDYPKTQLNYGDVRAVSGRPLIARKPVPGSQPTQTKTQEVCPNCGKLFWVDKKKCFNCGWHSLDTLEKPQSKKEPLHEKITVYCPRCSSPMVLRTAKQGHFAGQKFWGCSRFPDCHGISSYRD